MVGKSQLRRTNPRTDKMFRKVPDRQSQVGQSHVKIGNKCVTIMHTVTEERAQINVRIGRSWTDSVVRYLSRYTDSC